METIKLRGFGPHSHFAGAEVVQATSETDLNILATILEPAKRGDARSAGRPYRLEGAWQSAILRWARLIARGNPHTIFVQIDPGRDNAETVLL